VLHAERGSNEHGLRYLQRYCEWAVREVTLVVTWSPYGQDDKRYYSERVSIDPQKTERVTIRLGLQLPLDTQLRNKRGLPIGPPSQHWGWNLAGAKGHQIH
jgi:hypothetical protein